MGKKDNAKYYIRLDKALELTESIVRDCYYDFVVQKKPATLEQELEFQAKITESYSLKLSEWGIKEK